jgi:hypothetical protein
MMPQMQMVLFMKRTARLGAAMRTTRFSSGAWSLEAWRKYIVGGCPLETDL